MKNHHLNVQLSLACFFGWLLAVPFSGPILENLLQTTGTDGAAITLTFIGAHGLAYVFAGFGLWNLAPWKNIMRAAGTACLLIHLLILTAGPVVPWLSFSLLGIASAVFILAWSVPYTNLITDTQRIKYMATIIIGANLILFFLSILSRHLHPNVMMVVAALPLALALYLAGIITPVTNPRKPAKGSEEFPTLLVAALALLVLIIYINGGLLYNLLYPSVITASPTFEYVILLPYTGMLVIMACLGGKMKKVLPVYLGAALLGLAFVFFALLNISFVSNLIIVVLTESAFALLDLFVWTVPATIALIYGRTYRVFGLVLAANVASIFLGYILGDHLLLSEQYRFTSGLVASGTLFLTFLLLPWLSEYLDQKFITDHKPLSISLADKLTCSEPLTPREEEILLLLLQGHSNKKTAALLFISENTLKTHLRHIYAKLGISHKRELFSLVAEKRNAK